MEIDRILSASSYSEFPGLEHRMFYAQAWAIVHYLTLEHESDEPMSGMLARYVELRDIGVAIAPVFEEAFGEPLRLVEKRLIAAFDQRRSRVIGIPLSALEYDRTPPTVRSPSRDELHVRLGQLCWRRGKSGYDDARAEFEAALRIDPKDARARAGLGETLKRQGRWDEAEPHFRRAVELDGRDPWNHLDLAEFLHDRGLSDEPGGDRSTILDEAREFYRRALALDDARPEPWLMLGRTHLLPGQDASVALDRIQRAYALLPGQPFVLESLVEAFVANGRVDLARDEYPRLRPSLERTGESPAFDDWLAELEAERAEQAEAWATPEPSAVPDEPQSRSTSTPSFLSSPTSWIAPSSLSR